MSWYKEFKFDNNPLSIKPTGKFELFFDNKSLVEDIIKVINKKENLVLKGSLGTGKTSILKKIIEKFGGDRKLYYYNAFSSSNPLDFERVLKKSGGLFSRIFNIKSKKVVLFIDEAFHLTDENIKDLKNYLDSHFKSVILASSDPNYEVPKELRKRFNKKINLENFTQKDAFNLIKHRLGKEKYKEILKDSEIRSIHKDSDSPREFLLECDYFCHKKYGV